MCTATDVSNFLFFIVSFFSKYARKHKLHSAMHLQTSTPTADTHANFFFFLSFSVGSQSDWHPLVSTSVTPSSSLWSRHRTAERGPWKYLRSAAWGGESEGKKLAFNKQDNGCHTPLLTPPLPAISLSLSTLSFLLSLAMLHPLYLTFSIKIAFIV